MDKHALQEFLQKPYQNSQLFLENVIFPIFGTEDYEWAGNLNWLQKHPEDRAAAQNAGLLSIILVGCINVEGSQLDIFDVTVESKHHLANNRVGIQKLVRQIISTHSGAFILFHYKTSDRWDWRFTFCHKGASINDSTDAKRYTFLLGPGQSCRTAAENFDNLRKNIAKNGSFTMKDIIGAFDVEALSDEFFDKYKEQYVKFVSYMADPVNGMREHFIDTDFDHEGLTDEEIHIREEKPLRDYVKKLLGRIVFLYFLQKKGWLGVEPEKNWGDGDTDFMLHLFEKASDNQKASFLDEVLEPLFEEGLNTNRSDNSYLFDTGIKALPNDGVLKVPYLNGGLFERDAADEPESVFPADYFGSLLKLLSQYNFTIDENDPNDAQVGIDPEMLGRIFENLLEDNKDKGTFYTPKNIVQYMCQESLIAFLQKDKNDVEKQLIRQFVLSYDTSPLPDDLKWDIDRKLKEVKVCDPAIGSGAFPMGVLKEIFYCRGAIENFTNAAKIKKDIINNNLYGVDIEKGAVDIARLRFWLAIVVDEVSPTALPNLDYKVMQGNSLLEKYKRVDLSQLLVDSESSDKMDGGLFGNVDIIEDTREELKQYRDAFFNCQDHEEKSIIKEDISSAIKIQLSGRNIDIDFEDLDIAGNSEFFLWHTWFSEVFDNGGFDIVIGNPPYFVYEGNNKNELPQLRSIREYSIAFGGKLNAYKLFLANALRFLIKEDGINCFIFQNSFMADQQAANLRNYVLNNCQILTIDSYPERDSKKKRVFESVKMSVCILLLKNTNTHNRFLVNVWDDKYKSSGISTYFTKEEIEAIDSQYMTIPRLREEAKPIVLKMIERRAISIKCLEGELNVTSHRPFFSNDNSLPVIMKGAGIQKYYYTFDMSQGEIEYLKEQEYLQSCGNAEKAHHHEFERIVMQGMTGANDKIRLVMSIVPAGIYLGHSCKYILPSENLSNRCLLGFMNSKLANFFFRCFSTNSNVNGYEVEAIPICNIPQDSAEKIESHVVNIMAAKQEDHSADTLNDENAIDSIIYHLYELSFDEVLIIDPDTPIRKADYELVQSE